MFDQLSADILASLIKGFPRTRTRTRTTTRTTTTKQNVDPAVHFVYSRVKSHKAGKHDSHFLMNKTEKASRLPVMIAAIISVK
jgi:hypothetical protein